MVWKNDQVSRKETELIIDFAKKALKFDGDFVEMGCYKGDTSLVLAELLKKTNKKLWLYDSFEGLPEKSVQDESILGVDFKKGELFATKRELKERFLRANLKVPVIKKAWFSDLSSNDLPDKIAFCFIDGDLYRSTLDCLKLIESKMIKNGVILVHDYNNLALPGVKKAVDEWSEERIIKIADSLAIIN